MLTQQNMPETMKVLWSYGHYVRFVSTIKLHSVHQRVNELFACQSPGHVVRKQRPQSAAIMVRWPNAVELNFRKDVCHRSEGFQVVL